VDILIYLAFGILGLLVGNLSNVFIVRVPLKMKIFNPSFRCDICKGRIRWYDNVPLFSFIFLKGHCRNCKSQIPLHYLFVELINMILWIVCALLFWHINTISTIIFALTCSVLVVIAFIDSSHKIIPDRFIILLLFLSIIAMIFCDDLVFYERIIGFALGGGILFTFYLVGRMIAKREVMGLGDIKLMAVSGLIIGWKGILLALFTGSILASIVLFLHQLNKMKKIKIENKNNNSVDLTNLKNEEYPLAPFLVIGIIFALFVGDFIIEWYANFFA